MPKSILILCLGNDMASDDAFGPTLARRLKEGPELPEDVEVVFTPVAGFYILDLLPKRKRVLIVDVMMSGVMEPGTVQLFPASQIDSGHHFTSGHQISVPTVIELGHKMGIEMPRTIDVLAVEGKDVSTLGGDLTPPVRAAIEPALEKIYDWLR